MQPNQQGRDRQIATLGDIKMLAENIGQIENNHRQLVGNINEIVQWVRSIDQAAFIAIHNIVNNGLEFNEDAVKKTTEFIQTGRANMDAYQKEQDDKKIKDMFEYVGEPFTVAGKEYARVKKAKTDDSFTEDGKPISYEQYEAAAQRAYTDKKKAEADTEDIPEEDKALAAAQDAKDKDTAQNEAQQAPAEPLAPMTEPAPEEEATDDSSSEES